MLMAEPFLSEIRIMSFGFPPKGWALCDGQLLPINQNQALFSLLGTTYGGDGRVNFGLPNLQGRAPIHMGSSHTLGERGGEQAHTLSISEIPTHTHVANATTAAGNATTPTTTSLLGTSTVQSLYATASNLQAMAPNAVANVGGSQAHLNMQPFLVLNFSIALQGIFPSQT
jgi:microcystin-dependent protein